MKAYDAAALRQQAEKKTAGSPESNVSLSPDAARQALHELQVHQIELEIQNEELRRSQAELDAARARYFSLYDLAPVGYVTLSEQGLILEANLTAATLLGVDRGRLVKQRASQFILEEDQDLYYRLRKQLFATGEPQECELRMTRNAGVFWAHLTETAAQDAGGAAVCRVVLSDITARKFQEDERELTARLILMLNAPGDFRRRMSELTAALQGWSGCEAVGIRLHAGDDYPYFETCGFQPAFIHLENHLCAFGRNGELLRDADGKPVLKCMCGNVLSERFDPSKPYFTEQGSFWSNNTSALLASTAEADRDPHMLNRCNGEGYESAALIPLRAGGHIFGLLQFNDHRPDRFTPGGISHFERMADSLAIALARRQAEEALHRANATLKAAMDQSPAGIAIADAPDGKLRYVNDAGLMIRGGTRKTIVDGVGIDQYVASWQLMDLDGAPLKPDEVPLARAVLFGETNSREFVVKKTTGDDRTVLANAAPIKDEDGKVVAGIVVFADITERKRAEGELLKMQKLQSIGTLAGGIAHDFNNILLGLFGNISLAKDELPKGHPAAALLEESEKVMARAVRLTKQLLTFAKGGDPVKEDVSLGTLVEDIVRFDLSGSNVSLVYQQAAALWMAKADKGQIQQVISNLTINARQAMPEGGHLFVTLKNVKLKEDEIPPLPCGRYVKITVRDEGSGIDPKVLGRIFDTYFTTKQAGSGLGLATAYSIITKHGGHIGVVSELGKGATFTIHLPACDALRQPESAPRLESGAPAERAVRVLVMDDEEMICDLVAKMLRPCGFVVASAPGGKEALELYSQALEAGEPFDAVIMDLTIPAGIGGRQAIKSLLAIDPHARAIVSSGYADDPVMASYTDFGFKGVAIKPYTRRGLLEVLGQVLRP